MNRALANSRSWRAWRCSAALLVLLPALALAACTPSALNAKQTFNVTPSTSDVSFWHHYEADSTSPLGTCGINLLGVGPGSLAGGSTMVGFKNIYDPGTEPLPCMSWLSEVYRGVVRFDLSQIQNLPRVFVQHANLNFVIDSSESCVRSAKGRCMNDARNCVGEAMAATIDVRGKTHVPGDLPAGDSYGFGSGGDVTALVRDWITGARPNFGFVFKGFDESHRKDNGACFSILRGFMLTVTVLTP